MTVRAESRQPNIILILVDDMGWGDMALNSRGAVEASTPQIATPHLAKLAQQGVLLTRHYTCAPVCAPARASLFSGVHQGHAEVVRNNSFDAALENSHTLASVLRICHGADWQMGNRRGHGEWRHASHCFSLADITRL